MNPLARAFNAVGGRLMVRSGKIGILVTTGRKSGLPRSAPLGFLRREDGSIVIAAGGVHRGWTANLQATPFATFRIKDVSRQYRARLLAEAERDAALAGFVAAQGRFGRANWGDVFLLEPLAAGSRS